MINPRVRLQRIRHHHPVLNQSRNPQQLRKDPKEPQAGGSQDPAQYQFAMLRKTVHVISCWNQPAQGSAATRMACGRQLVTSALQMLTHAEIAQSPGTLCNHPGCRQIWSNFDA